MDGLVTDAVRLLAELPDVELGEAAVNAVGLLALVAGQDVEPAEDSDGRDGRWRIARRTVPDRMVSTVDPETRHVHNARTHRQEGFKAHIAIEPETGLITAAQLTPGTGGEHHEATVALDLLDGEPEGLQIFGDTAYSSDAACGTLTRAGHELFLKPAPLKTAVVGGFSLDDFAIDTTAGTVTCPAGHQVALSEPSGMHLQRKATFADQCTGCPLRQRCTKAKAGRILTIRPNRDHQAAARQRAATDADWQSAYRRWRPPVERVIAWITAGGNRRLRYRGAIKNDAWLNTRAAALNLRTLINLGLHRTEEGWALAQA